MECVAARLLEEELKTYEAHRLELLGSDEGKWVLIHGDKLAGVFESQGDAVRAGYGQFGNVPFLVKQALPVEMPENFVSNHPAL